MRRFVADAGHELRTPLTAIRGFAEYYRQRGGLVPHWDRRAPAAPTAAGAGAVVSPETDRAMDGLTPEDLDRLMQRVERKPPGWACSSRTCCCWPGSTSSVR